MRITFYVQLPEDGTQMMSVNYAKMVGYPDGEKNGSAHQGQLKIGASAACMSVEFLEIKQKRVNSFTNFKSWIFSNIK